jgi:hypothetical protein
MHGQHRDLKNPPKISDTIIRLSLLLSSLESRYVGLESPTYPVFPIFMSYLQSN